MGRIPLEDIAAGTLLKLVWLATGLFWLVGSIAFGALVFVDLLPIAYGGIKLIGTLALGVMLMMVCVISIVAGIAISIGVLLARVLPGTRKAGVVYRSADPLEPHKES